MRVADGSGTNRDGQSIGPDEDERPGFGLLARVVGAVFLVVLGALLLLDRAQSGATREQVAQRESCGKRDIRVVVDDDRKVERRSHATPVAPLSGNEQRPSKNIFRGNWHDGCNDNGMSFELTSCRKGAREAEAPFGLSASGQSLPGGGQ